MNTKLRTAVIFLSGCLLGAVVAGSFVAWHWNRNFETWYMVQLADQAYVAQRIYSGEADQLAESILSSLPESAASANRMGAVEQLPSAILAVSEAYAAAGQSPPATLQDLIDNLPPGVSCAKRKSGEGP